MNQYAQMKEKETVICQNNLPIVMEKEPISNGRLLP